MPIFTHIMLVTCFIVDSFVDKVKHKTRNKRLLSHICTLSLIYRFVTAVPIQAAVCLKKVYRIIRKYRTSTNIIATSDVIVLTKQAALSISRFLFVFITLLLIIIIIGIINTENIFNNLITRTSIGSND